MAIILRACKKHAKQPSKKVPLPQRPSALPTELVIRQHAAINGNRHSIVNWICNAIFINDGYWYAMMKGPTNAMKNNNGMTLSKIFIGCSQSPESRISLCHGVLY